MKMMMVLLLMAPSLGLASEMKCSVADFMMNTTHEMPDTRVEVKLGNTLTSVPPYHYQASEYAEDGFIVLSILKDTDRGRRQLALARVSLQSARLELTVDDQTYKVISCQ